MGPSPTSTDNLRRLLAELYIQPGISGACLQVGGATLLHDLPYSDDRVMNFAARIDQLISSYEGVGRQIWQVCAGFDSFTLLILCRSNVRLTLLLQPGTDPALASNRATRLIMEVEMQRPQTNGHSHPVLEKPQAQAQANGSPGDIPREEFERLISGLMNRVSGSAQTAKLIQRELGDNRQGLSKADARRIGLTLLDYIPNRGKRAALSSEFLNALDS